MDNLQHGYVIVKILNFQGRLGYIYSYISDFKLLMILFQTQY